MGKRYNFLRRKKALIHKANCTTEFCTGTRKLYPNICTLNKSIFIFCILCIELQITIFSTLFFIISMYVCIDIKYFGIHVQKSAEPAVLNSNYVS